MNREKPNKLSCGVRRFFLIWGFVVIFTMTPNILVYAQENSIFGGEQTYSEKLRSLLNSEDYKGGIQLSYQLMEEGKLTELDFLNVSLCFQYLNKYDELIEFVNGWESKYPSKTYNILNAIRGECFFWKEKYLESEPYFFSYVERERSLGRAPDATYLGEYASCLYMNHKYKEADKYFKVYFKEMALFNDVKITGLPDTEGRGIYGFYFYNFAYNAFMQGQEKRGATLLELSSKCGYENASKDIRKLKRNLAYANDYAYKSSTIREFEKYIGELNYYKGLPEYPSSFWYQVQKDNVEYQKLNTALHKPKMSQSVMSAINKINGLKAIADNGIAECYPYKVGEMEQYLDKAICGDQTFLKEIRFYPAKYENAFTTPSGQIYITEALYNSFNANKDLLLAVCAHEAAHFIFQHSLAEEWKVAKKERRNEVWGQIAAGLNAAAHAGVAIYGASNGVSSDAYGQDYWNNVNQANFNLIQSFRDDAFYFRFKYGRSQELESDIVAYRFCEATGIGGYAMIMALQLLDGESMYLKSDKTSDHPSNAFRIGLLKHLWAKDHPDLAEKNKNFGKKTEKK